MTQDSPAKKPRQSRTKKLRYAVVGLGHIAQNAVLPAFAGAARRAELAALVCKSVAIRKDLLFIRHRHGFCLQSSS